MPKNSKQVKKSKKNQHTSKLLTPIRSFGRAAKESVNNFLSRRPHRSFRLTRRIDCIRPIKLPGLFSFSNEVTRTLWRHRKVFALVSLVYIVLYGVLVGISSQETYQMLSDALSETSAEVMGGSINALGQAGLVFLSISSMGLTDSMTEAQQIFSILIFILIWLTTVWLLRNLMAGHKVKLRDALYNAGAPIVSSLIIVLVIIVQMIPIGLAIIGYAAASATGLLAGGAPTMLFWLAAMLAVTLTLYWVTSSLFALIVVTLPGMYPMKAIRTAGDIMVGRRLKILTRWLWMLLTIAVVWSLVLIPVILLDSWVKSVWDAISWLPIVPVAMLVSSAVAIVWTSAYVYLLYRKVVDND